ncbi:MAG: hypothetical protein AAB486_04580 [Patescibacteria group bacterium]
MSHASLFRRLAVVVVVSGPILVAYLYFNRPASETISPTRETAAKKSGNNGFHPFGLLLGLSEDRSDGGEVLGIETTVTPEPIRSEKTGLLDRLISTFSDNLRVTPTPSSTPSPTPTPTLTSTPVPASLSAGQAAVTIQANSTGTALITKNYSSLYNLMGVEFRTNYSYDDFVNSLGQSGSVTGFVVQSLPRLFGTVNEWAEVRVQLTQSTGVVKSYNEVFHLENGVWKLYGTEEVN